MIETLSNFSTRSSSKDEKQLLNFTGLYDKKFLLDFLHKAAHYVTLLRVLCKRVQTGVISHFVLVFDGICLMDATTVFRLLDLDRALWVRRWTGEKSIQCSFCKCCITDLAAISRYFTLNLDKNLLFDWEWMDTDPGGGTAIKRDRMQYYAENRMRGFHKNGIPSSTPKNYFYLW
jgi:hypothetical protein